MLTAEVNGRPLGILRADRDGTMCHICERITFLMHLKVSSLVSVFIEEDSDEIKIGTCCKNGGCTKVGERVSASREKHCFIHSYGVEMCTNPVLW